MRGCSKAEPGGRREAGYEFWVLSAEFSPFSLQPRTLPLRAFPASLAGPAHLTERERCQQLSCNLGMLTQAR